MARRNSVDTWLDAPKGGPLPCELFGAMAELCSVCAIYHEAYVEAAVDAAGMDRGASSVLCPTDSTVGHGVDCGQSEAGKEVMSWTSTETIAWLRLVDPTRHPWCMTEAVEGAKCDACRGLERG